MNSTEIFNNVVASMKEVFEDDSIVVTTETNAEDIENWDSLTHIVLISTIEKKFKLRFALGELQALRNVGDMVQLIQNKL
jgi:acyl carrier protein